MTLQELREYREHSFDAFCKKVIKYAAADAHRTVKRQHRGEVGIDDPIVA